MSQAFYRKYRPQNFSEIVGQNHIKTTLQNEILTEQISHAYLFTGPHGIGKTSLARIMAKSLNCIKRKKNEFEPCNQCESCKNITAGKSLDLIEIDAATHTQVDKVRENIIENVRFVPHNSKYKIFIIDEVHMLSTAAFNALLKTLEEPPEYVVFILCTTEAHKLPETIISRCQRFDFKKVPVEQIAQKLGKIVNQEKINIDDKVLNMIAWRSGGFVRDAESLLSQVVSLLANNKKLISLEDIEPILPRSNLESIANLINALINNDIKMGVETINKLVSDGVDLERFNLDLIDYLRKMVLIKIGLRNRDYNLMGLSEKIEAEIIAQTEKLEMPKLTKILEKFIAQQNAIKNAEIPQLPLEIAVIELCNSSDNFSNIDPPSLNKDGIKNRPDQTTASKFQGHEKQSKDGKQNLKKQKPNYSGINNSDTNNNGDNKNEALKKIKQIWPEFIKQAQQINNSLPLILKLAHPVGIDNNILKIGFEFEIHIKRMKDKKILNAAEKILGELLHTNINIKPILLSTKEIAELKRNQEDTQTQNDVQIDKILQTFGGKIIE